MSPGPQEDQTLWCTAIARAAAALAAAAALSAHGDMAALQAIGIVTCTRHAVFDVASAA